MLKLIIDIGNTASKIAIFNKDKIVDKIIYQKRITVKDLIRLRRTKKYQSKIQSAILCSVINHPKEITNFLKNNYSFIDFSFSIPLPIKILYKTLETLGKDRIAGAVGGYHTFPNKNTLVIDCGTCITYDFITANNKYLGGGISPGLEMRFKALHNFTDKLPLLNTDDIPQHFKELIGKDTKNSIFSGIINGVIAEIDGIIKKYKTKFFDLKVILSGGDSTFLYKRLKNKVFLNPDNTLIGLNVILEHNVKHNNYSS